MTKDDVDSRAKPVRKVRSRLSLIRLFGSPRELLAKADADLNRLVEALSRGQQRAAIWALMDCAIAVFHTGDWLRATHTDHRASSLRFANRSQWIRMVRDICHAAKHGDLTWDEAQAGTHEPVVAKLEYQRGPARGDQHQARFWVVARDESRHNVVDVLQHAILDWIRYLDRNGV
jgi:hypothetical protein